ncbi:MAG: hypothetical protein ACFFBC_15125 [Promethearchaeota archaeon]
MKKTKIILISLIGLLILTPFMTTTRAQPPSYVGVAVEERYEFNLNVENQASWDQWFADNMTDWWAAAWTHDSGSTLSAVYSGTLSWDPSPPQLVFFFEIDSIEENITTGQTEINTSAGYLVPDWPPADSYYSQINTIGNDTAKFAYESLYGGMASTAYWFMGVPFAPKNVNWTEFVLLGNAGLNTTFWNITNPDEWNYDLTMTEISNGYSMYSPAMGFGNNSLSIRINTTYDTNGILTYHSFEYGGVILYEFVPGTYTPPAAPIITGTPPDFMVPNDYTGESISWTATDANPANYTVELQGTGVVAGPTAWSSDVAITYNIPDGLSAGTYTYIVNFTDIFGLYNTDIVIMTVEPPDTTDPVITDSPSDFSVKVGYSGESISWTATDANPGTYTIKLNGSEIVGPTIWSSGIAVTYNIPDGLGIGLHTYEINFTDSSGNSQSDTVIFTVEEKSEAAEVIPGYGLPIIFGVVTLVSIGLIVIMKKRNRW